MVKRVLFLLTLFRVHASAQTPKPRWNATRQGSRDETVSVRTLPPPGIVMPMLHFYEMKRSVVVGFGRCSAGGRYF